MTGRFEVSWHGGDTGTMSARVNSRPAMESLRALISADPDLMVSAVVEVDEDGVPVRRSGDSRFARLVVPIAVAVAPAEVPACQWGGPFLCARFPQCGHLAAVARFAA